MKEIRLVRTCVACPEQYDAFLGEEKVGYLRLRHGSFTVHVPDWDGELVLETCPHGDSEFEDWERDVHLGAAKAAIFARRANA